MNQTETKTKTEKTYPSYYSWKQVGEVIHETSFNGVMAFIRRNKINPCIPGRKLLFDKDVVHETIKNTMVVVGR